MPGLNKRIYGLLLAFFISGFLTPAPFSHSCIYPDITFDTLSPGVVRKVSCFREGGFGSCMDTMVFKESELITELRSNYAAKKFAIMGKFTSITRKLRLDTTWYDTTIIIPVGGIRFDVNNYMDETVTLEVDQVIKGGFDKQKLVFPHTWFYNEESTYVAKWDTLLDSISYDPAAGKRFVAFFDTYDSISHLGFAPTVDCYFVVSGYFIEGDRIRKRGVAGAHGISVSLEDFMSGLSIKNRFTLQKDLAPGRRSIFVTLSPNQIPAGRPFFDITGRLYFPHGRHSTQAGFRPGVFILK